MRFCRIIRRRKLVYRSKPKLYCSSKNRLSNSKLNIKINWRVDDPLATMHFCQTRYLIGFLQIFFGFFTFGLNSKINVVKLLLKLSGYSHPIRITKWLNINLCLQLRTVCFEVAILNSKHVGSWCKAGKQGGFYLGRKLLRRLDGSPRTVFS